MKTGEAVPDVPVPDVPGWDQPRADAVLADALARLDGPLARAANTTARRAVLVHYRDIVCGYHRNHHPLLWEAVAGLDLLLGRWASADRDAAAIKPPAAGGRAKSARRKGGMTR
jgi:hypothetical protein